MQLFIRKPSIDFYTGVIVDKDTELEYSSDSIEQTVKDLVLHTVMKAKGDEFESIYDTTIYLSEGDILIYEENGRGYIKPVESFVTVADAIKDLENIKDIGDNT